MENIVLAKCFTDLGPLSIKHQLGKFCQNFPN